MAALYSTTLDAENDYKFLEEKPVFKFYVPSLTRDKKEIVPDSRKMYIAAIEGRALKLNGGFNKWETDGGYAAKDGSVMCEKNLVIETYGLNPFTDLELSRFAKLLDQEVLFVHESGISKAYMYDGETKEVEDFFQDITTDGEIIRYYKEPIPFGRGYKIMREITDEEGNPLSVDYISESEMCDRISEGDQSVVQMMQQLGISL